MGLGLIAITKHKAKESEKGVKSWMQRWDYWYYVLEFSNGGESLGNFVADEEKPHHGRYHHYCNRKLGSTQALSASFRGTHCDIIELDWESTL